MNSGDKWRDCWIFCHMEQPFQTKDAFKQAKECCRWYISLISPSMDAAWPTDHFHHFIKEINSGCKETLFGWIKEQLFYLTWILALCLGLVECFSNGEGRVEEVIFQLPALLLWWVLQWDCLNAGSRLWIQFWGPGSMAAWAVNLAGTL